MGAPQTSKKGPNAMEYEEAKTKVVEALTKKQKDQIQVLLQRPVQDSRNETARSQKDRQPDGEENVLEYWSSGSTSMYGLPGTGKQAGAEHED
jgi:hypothetical protein